MGSNLRSWCQVRTAGHLSHTHLTLNECSHQYSNSGPAVPQQAPPSHPTPTPCSCPGEHWTQCSSSWGFSSRLAPPGGGSILPKTLCSSVLKDGIFHQEVSPRQADSGRFWSLQPSPQSSHFWRGGTRSKRMTHTQSQLHSLDFRCRFHYSRSASKCGGSLTLADYGLLWLCLWYSADID